MQIVYGKLWHNICTYKKKHKIDSFFFFGKILKFYHRHSGVSETGFDGYVI